MYSHSYTLLLYLWLYPLEGTSIHMLSQLYPLNCTSLFVPLQLYLSDCTPLVYPSHFRGLAAFLERQKIEETFHSQTDVQINFGKQRPNDTFIDVLGCSKMYPDIFGCFRIFYPNNDLWIAVAARSVSSPSHTAAANMQLQTLVSSFQLTILLICMRMVYPGISNARACFWG